MMVDARRRVEPRSGARQVCSSFQTRGLRTRWGLFLVAFVALSGCGDGNPLFVRPAVTLGRLDPGVHLLDSPLDLSPDGRWLLFARRNPAGVPEGIFLLSLDPDSSAHRLMPVDPYLLNPSGLRFSPDARKIAMVQYDASGARIHVFDIGSGADSAISPPEFIASSPDWDPTGRYIVYDRPWLNAGDPDSVAGIHIIDLETMSDRALRHGGTGTFGGQPRWSPDGVWIAFWYGTRLSAGSRPPMAIHLYRVRPDGSDYADLTPRFTVDHSNPMWVNAGSELLFEVSDPPRQATFIMRADGTDRRMWPINLLGSPLVVVSRDGINAVFTDVDASGRYGVLYIQRADDVGGGSRRQVTSPPPDSVLSQVP